MLYLEDPSYLAWLQGLAQTPSSEGVVKLPSIRRLCNLLLAVHIWMLSFRSTNTVLWIEHLIEFPCYFLLLSLSFVYAGMLHLQATSNYGGELNIGKSDSAVYLLWKPTE